ncbi:MAG: urate oxidase [Actinobacteria bacterium]|nr:urate oxidase [Actinomycetota bacterium]
MPLGDNTWGKSAIRLSKVHRGGASHDFSDLTVSVRLEGEVTEAHIAGDNSMVLPTDTMRNTVYGLAHRHLGRDLEGFAATLCGHFLESAGVTTATVSIAERLWRRVTPTGFHGGGSESRLARVTRGDRTSTQAGVEGLVLLKTTGSAFTGFPRDRFTTLPEATDRLLATSVTAEWLYSTVPADTTAVWSRARQTLVDHFFADRSASMQHQGYQMGEAVLAEVPEIAEITLHLPNQHHLPFDVTRFNVEDTGTVFHPVTEPYGDIRLTVTRNLR